VKLSDNARKATGPEEGIARGITGCLVVWRCRERRCWCKFSFCTAAPAVNSGVTASNFFLVSANAPGVYGEPFQREQAGLWPALRPWKAQVRLMHR
jgi:hypothetical protein